MKYFSIFLFLLLSVTTQAQDSTKIKLQQYKEWHESGLIGDEEYAKAKAKLLGVVPSTQAPIEKQQTPIVQQKPEPVPTVSADHLKDKYTGFLAGGSVLIIGGAAMFVGGIAYLIRNNVANIPTNSGVVFGLIGAGGVCMAAGGILLSVGLKQKQIYLKQNKSISLNLGLNNIGLAYNF